MVYDYAIIGAGAAGLQLALAMARDHYFDKHQILILEPDDKSANDKTWCFWEKGAGIYDDIITSHWDTALFFGSQKSLKLPLGSYSYKMLRSIDFYKYAKNTLEKHANIQWASEAVSELTEEKNVKITAKNTYQAKHVFDSRMLVDAQELSQANGVLQHFLGWEIETDANVFDTASFTMMDYRLKWPESTSFMYVLPTAPNKALLEFTFFSSAIANAEDYEKMLKNYIQELLNINEYSINAIEKGVIPMYDYNFHEHHTQKVTKIGTAGGWVKASSGYSFKNSSKKCDQLITNIKANKPVIKNLYNKRHALYDGTFLRVLEKENYLGEQLFTTMYSENSIETVFAFLDEETSFGQEVGLMNSFPKAKFGKAMASVLLQ